MADRLTTEQLNSLSKDELVSMMMSMHNLNPMLYETTDIIDTFVYRSITQLGDYSMSSAVSLYQSLFGFILVLLSNYIVGKFSPESRLF